MWFILTLLWISLVYKRTAISAGEVKLSVRLLIKWHRDTIGKWELNKIKRLKASKKPPIQYFYRSTIIGIS